MHHAERLYVKTWALALAMAVVGLLSARASAEPAKPSAPAAQKTAETIASQPDALVVKRITAERLPAVAAAFDANLIAGQNSDGSRFVLVRKKADASFKTLDWLGLKDRDIIERTNKTAVRSKEAVLGFIRETKPNTEVTFTVRRGGQKRTHVLRVDAAPPVQGVQPPAQGVQPAPDDGVLVVREDVIEAEWAKQDPWLLLIAAAPEMVRDTNGNVAGVRSQSFSDIPLAQMLGLRNGDIVQSVNGYPINSEQAIFDLLSKLDGERQFTARVLRNGKPITLKYRIE